MLDPSTALSDIPDGLRKPLLQEYNSIVQNYMERRWTPSELSGGKLCEIVYTILDGFAKSKYPSGPSKPAKFVDACKKLEQNSNVPRSFQILIPRLLPALYEIRNNRGVGHSGAEVDPNHMDSVAVLSLANWIMAEMVRVFHRLGIEEAQQVVDSLTERRVPLVWQFGNLKRVLNPDLPLPDQMLLLIASSPAQVKTEDLFRWVGYKNQKYLRKILRQLHSLRQLEYDERAESVMMLPPGAKYIQKRIAELDETT